MQLKTVKKKDCGYVKKYTKLAVGWSAFVFSKKIHVLPLTGYQDMSPEQTAGRRTDRICTADACVELQMRCLGPPSGVKPIRTKPRGTMVKPDR